MINVMTYDFHGSWDPMTGECSPLFRSPEDQGGFIYFNVVRLKKILLNSLQTAIVGLFKCGLGYLQNTFYRTMLWTTGWAREPQLRSWLWVSLHMAIHSPSGTLLTMVLEHLLLVLELQESTHKRLENWLTLRYTFLLSWWSNNKRALLCLVAQSWFNFLWFDEIVYQLVENCRLTV